MSTVRQHTRHQLRVSAYDRVSSWLVSLLFVTCLTVGSLILIYFTRKFILQDVTLPVTPVQSGGGGTGGVGGTPGESNDAPANRGCAGEHQRAADSGYAQRPGDGRFQTQATLADEQIDVGMEPTQGTGGDNRTPGFGGGRGGGIGGGIGSGFGPGRGGPPEPRREIRFEPANLLEYAQWLDFFKIELGVLNPQDNKIYYAYNLAQAKPGVRVDDPAKEIRLFMNPTDSQFAALDRQLCQKAGIADKGQIILQFYPNDAAGILYTLEKNYAGAHERVYPRHSLPRQTYGGHVPIQRGRSIVSVLTAK